MKLSSVAMDVQPRVQLMTVSAPDRGLWNRLTWLVTCMDLTVRSVLVLLSDMLIVRVTVTVVVVPRQPKLLLTDRRQLLRVRLLLVTRKEVRVGLVG